MVVPLRISTFKVHCIYFWYRLLSPFLLRYYNQVPTTFTNISDASDNILKMNCLVSIATKKLLFKIVGHKLQRNTLCDTRRVDLLDFIDVLLVPTSEQSPEPEYIITLPRNTLQELLHLYIYANNYLQFSQLLHNERTDAKGTWRTERIKSSKC